MDCDETLTPIKSKDVDEFRYYKYFLELPKEYLSNDQKNKLLKYLYHGVIPNSTMEHIVRLILMMSMRNDFLNLEEIELAIKIALPSETERSKYYHESFEKYFKGDMRTCFPQRSTSTKKK